MATIISGDLTEDERTIEPGDRVDVAAGATYAVGTLTVDGAVHVGEDGKVRASRLVNAGTVANRGELSAGWLDNRPGARFENRGVAALGRAHSENDNRGVIAGLAHGVLVLLATRNHRGGSIRAVGSTLRLDGVVVNEPGAEMTSRTGATIDVASGLYSAGLILNGRGCVFRTRSGMQVRSYLGGELRNRGAIVNGGRIIDLGGPVRQLGTITGHPIEHETGTDLPY